MGVSMRKFLLILSTFLLSACYPYYIMMGPGGYPSQYIVRIESDARYSGYVGTQMISGFSTKSYPIYSGECYSISKERFSSGYVRVFVTYSNYYEGGAFPKFQDKATTSYTILSGCL